MLLTIILIVAGALALPLAVGTLARVAGYGWTRGAQRAQRAIAPYSGLAPDQLASQRRRRDAIHSPTVPMRPVPVDEETLSRLSSGGW